MMQTADSLRRQAAGRQRHPASFTIENTLGPTCTAVRPTLRVGLAFLFFCTLPRRLECA
jgi:hypothetical protein